MFNRTLDISNQRYGKLIAVSPHSKQGKQVMWRCRCDCGTWVNVRGSNLRARVNPTTSCGCATGYENLTGRIFGEWSVIMRWGSNGARISVWLCRCSCGQYGTVPATRLRDGQSGSCGCSKLTREGDSNSVEYAAWLAMVSRCYDPSVSSYRNYGARGIGVCDQWRRSYQDFLAHVGRRPTRGHSLDRIDNEEWYRPGNVRWATKIEQTNNTRANVRLEFGGKTMTVAEWGRELDMPAALIRSRLRMGMPVSMALTKEKGKHEQY